MNSKQENIKMDAKVEEVKQKFNGKVCCFGCAVEFVDSEGEKFLRHLLTNNFTIRQITREPELYSYLHSFDLKTIQNLEICRRAVIETHDAKLAPVIHRGFYQPQLLTVRYQFGDFEIGMGDLARGQVLEIFRFDSTCDIVENIINSLKDTFVQTLRKSFGFRDLPNVPFDQFFHFCYKTGSYQVSNASPNIKRSRWFTPDNWTSLTMRDHVSIIYRSITTAKRPTLFIFEGIFHPTGSLTTVSTWIQMLTRIFGGIEDFFVVFVIDYTSFSSPATADKLAARRLRNIFNSAELNNKIFWLDTTAADSQLIYAPKYGEHPEANKRMILELRRFDNGCV